MLRYNILLLAATAAWAALLLLPGGAAWGGEPRVVASILPIHSLVAGVMEGVATPRLLLEGAASPHGHALRPSEARNLRNAEVVFWVGAELESFLVRPLVSLAGQARVVALADAPGLRLLPAERAEAGKEETPSGHDHGHGSDPHLWLDPLNGQAMVAAIAKVLGEAYPAHAPRFAANAARLRERLAALDHSIRARLAPVAAHPFLVFHDAFRYFERRYGLHAVGAVAVAPERLPGARHLLALRQRIKETRVRCAFAEPQFDPALLKTLLAGTAARAAVLDPLGAELEPGPGLYFRLLGNLADGLVTCLGAP